MISKKTDLNQIHENVPKDYYQQGIKNNFFQRFWHQSRYHLIIEEIKKLNLSQRLLDIGCHSGDLTNLIFQVFPGEVYGLDISKQAIEYAQQRFKNINFIWVDFLKKTQFPDNYFQAITIFDTLEHLADVSLAIAEIKRLLQRGGYLIIGVPSENFLFKIVWFFWLKLKGKVWRDTHINKFDNKTFFQFEKAGFTKIKEKKIIFKMWRFIIFKLDKK